MTGFKVFLGHVAIHWLFFFICWSWYFILHACMQIKAIIKQRTKRFGSSDSVPYLGKTVSYLLPEGCGVPRTRGTDQNCWCRFCIARKSERLHCNANCMYFKRLETALKMNKCTLILYNLHSMKIHSRVSYSHLQTNSSQSFGDSCWHICLVFTCYSNKCNPFL